MKKYLVASAILLSFIGCSKKMDVADTTVPYVHVPVQFTVKEDFEMGTKAAYAIGDVSIKTGSWNFEDGLLGKTTADIKNDLQSVRLRTGKIGMNFDVDSITMLKINHAQYGTDAASVLTVWISDDKGATYTQLGTSLNTSSKTFITDTFKVTSTKPVRFQFRKVGTTRINIDDIIFIGAGNPGIIFNDPVDNIIDTAAYSSTPAIGRGFPSPTGIDVQPVDGDNSNLLFGNPSNALTNSVSIENYLIDFKYFTTSHSSSRNTPNWVSWHLDASNVATTSRQDNFAAFTGMPVDFYQVQSNSYSGSGFDRGHNCPSADRTSSVEANSATFLMPNMIPQAPNNNQKAWATLESYLRTEMQKGYEVYIIMGSYGKGGTGSNGYAETINNGKVVVPKRVWKIAVILPIGNGDLSRVTASTKILAVDTPNDNTADPDWTKYLTTVDAIEKSTTYDFLSKLPLDIQKILQAKVYIP